MSQYRPGRPPHRQQHAGGGQQESSLPADYLKDGYLDEKGNIRKELLQEDAQRVVRSLGRIETHQLRRFFHHLKDIETRLLYLKTVGQVQDAYETVAGDIYRLKGLSAYQAGRSHEWIPLKEFIERNVHATKTEKDFLRGFIPHFEAVVAYHSYKTSTSAKRRTI